MKGHLMSDHDNSKVRELAKLREDVGWQTICKASNIGDFTMVLKGFCYGLTEIHPL